VGIRPSISPVYEKDEHTGVQRLVGYKGDSQTESQKDANKTPKKGFGLDTDKQKKAVITKNSKRADTQEKILKRKGTTKKSDSSNG